MRFWDSSAVVPLLLEESGREPLLAVFESDPVMIVWWGTSVEIASALSRRECDGGLTLPEATAAIDRLRALERAWHEVVPTDTLRGRARRLVRVRPLRAADSLQLAAALNVAGDDPASLGFVSLDRRLVDAARREGLEVWSG